MAVVRLSLATIHLLIADAARRQITHRIGIDRPDPGGIPHPPTPRRRPDHKSLQAEGNNL
jgi:hypothetical protein